MLSRYRQPLARGRDREEIARARQAAEALFTAKPPKPLANPPAVPAPGPAEQAVRKPRVLQIQTPAPAARNEVPEPPPVAPAPSTRDISRSEFARIRTLVKYGMTAAQVAQLCGTGVDEIQHILRRRP